MITYASSEITIHKSETITLPFKHKHVKTSNLSFLQVSKGNYIENRFSNVKLEKNPLNKYGVNYIKISGLEEGNYILSLKKEEVRIAIAVHSGKIWDLSSDFILK